MMTEANPTRLRYLGSTHGTVTGSRPVEVVRRRGLRLKFGESMMLGSKVLAFSLLAVTGSIGIALAQTADAPRVGSASAQDAAVEAPVVLSPRAQALKALLPQGGDHAAALASFYAAHDYVPVWTASRLAALFAAFDQAGAHGLPSARYDEGLRALAIDPASDPLAVEVLASERFLTFARDINSGVLEPRKANREIHIYPKRPDAVALLEGLDAATDTAAYLSALAPTHPHYVTLLEEKRRLQGIVTAGGWGDQVPGGRSLKPGTSSSRVAVLRARLGRIDGVNYGDSAEYDDVLIQAVQQFQLRHGLNDDGVAGPQTLKAINATAEDRLRQVVVNLERQRWLNYDRGDRHVYVNQADFRVRIVDQGRISFDSRAVVGKLKHQTQEFNDTMTHLVVNPTWHVPRSIATEEMLPKLQANPTALGGSMQIMTRNGTRVNPALVDFTQFTASNFPFIVKQRPGGGNALGRVKFMFPNQFNIYLHDTPAKRLFGKDVRAYSHGCVRVQKPFEFAHMLLAPQTANPEDYFQSLLNTGRERQVNLETPIPVYLTYQTAWIDEWGIPQYRDDVYGRDRDVFRALEATGVTLGALEG